MPLTYIEYDVYQDELPGESHKVLLPHVIRILDGVNWTGPKKVFEVGCGNGCVAGELVERGYEVIGVDPSESGIRIANASYPRAQLHVGSCYDDLAAKYGTFDVVLSLEVIEHIESPRVFTSCVHSLLKDGGVAIISTPYHGYFKNLALSLTGRMDAHFTALWGHGHIKFWSLKTFRQLLTDARFSDIRFHRVGRIPPFAKSMIAVARR